MPFGLHDDELPVDVELVRRLTARQFPQWSDLPIEFAAAGTVNAMFRLGSDMVVRLPFVERGAEGIERERRWLPVLAPHLDVAVPTVLGAGEPDDEYPCPWSVLAWLPGRNPDPAALDSADAVARDLARFQRQLQQVDTAGAPPGYRGGRLAELDAAVIDSLTQIDDLVDAAALAVLWRSATAAPAWGRPPVWLHADLLTGNVLVDGSGLTGVLDFAAAGAGDPAADLMAAWSIVPAGSRGLFRSEVGADDATWLRGQGWALAQAAIALPYYRTTSPQMARSSLHILRELAG